MLTLITQQLPEFNLYLATPIVNNRPDHTQDFLFADASALKTFVGYYMQNPVAAIFAYYAQLDGYSVEVQYA